MNLRLLVYTSFFLLLPFFSISQNSRKVPWRGFGQQVWVFAWSPNDGALGRYAERAIAKWEESGDPGWIILIGRTEDSFWTIEGGLENDAEDMSFFAQIRQTYFDGRTKVHLMPAEIYKGNASAAILQQVWNWDKNGVLPKTEELMAVKRAYPEPSEDFGGRILQLIPPTGRTITYNFTFDTEMCWFFYRWEVF